ncbi:MAG: virulence RhuM family protein [Thermoanaerobaculaceae bacterium]|nr:virulence RhuM family protein [Thermoanaerobaculaceae bacterium]
MSDSKDIIRQRGEFLLYQTEDGRTQVEVRFDGETVWLSLGQMADLFQRDKSVISRHIKNVFDERELSPGATVARYATVQREGERDVTREVEYYNLDVIISVGYRVKSHRGTQFRIWATQRLREYIVKGFTLDDERLKRAGGGSYFDELLALVRVNPGSVREPRHPAPLNGPRSTSDRA